MSNHCACVRAWAWGARIMGGGGISPLHPRCGAVMVICMRVQSREAQEEIARLQGELQVSAPERSIPCTLALDRAHFLVGKQAASALLSGQTTLNIGGLSVEEQRIMDSSFTEFSRRYEFKSCGRGAKGKAQIKLRAEPAIVVVKPRMPKSWNAPGDEHRPTYCKIQLQKHMCFKDRGHFREFIFKQHDGDFEAAYEDFALHDPQAPSCCRNDFRETVFDDDGEEIVDPNEPRPEADPTFKFVETNPMFEAARAKAFTGGSNASFWAQRSQTLYSAAQVKDAEVWQRRQAASAKPPPPVHVNLDTMNVGQAFAYRAVMEHDALQRAGRVAARSFLVCGTAGSGKTYLIRALKQTLGDRCLVLAPTGVAADNIGGRTYQQLLPVPSRGNSAELNREQIRPVGKRLKDLMTDWRGVTHAIMDEMSMVGRLSLGLIDELLRAATKRGEPFGGINLILVGE